MDIIAAHQQGMIEQLDAEVEALAGGPRDHVQRAIVLHHLYEHSKGGHAWTLAEARRSLRITSGLAKLESRIGRWPWTIRDSDHVRAALAELAAALGEEARARMKAAYRAYRLSATKALRGEAEASLPPCLLELLDQCHSSRRAGVTASPDAQDALADACEQLAADAADPDRLAAAWAGTEATALRRAAQRSLGPKALAAAKARDQRRGWARVEQELRAEPSMPSSFRTNPAQHFYALLLALAERRRKQWREEADREPGAVALAA